MCVEKNITHPPVSLSLFLSLSLSLTYRKLWFPQWKWVRAEFVAVNTYIVKMLTHTINSCIQSVHVYSSHTLTLFPLQYFHKTSMNSRLWFATEFQSVNELYLCVCVCVCLSLSLPVCLYISHPSAGTCGCLRRVAAAQSRSGRCLIPVCTLSATPQTAATQLDSAYYGATHTYTHTHTHTHTKRDSEEHTNMQIIFFNLF